jgi:hypothetical protein
MLLNFKKFIGLLTGMTSLTFFLIKIFFSISLFDIYLIEN